jgi:hypothetical protein
MSTTTSRRVEQQSGAPRRNRVKRARLIRQASAWVPGRAPEPLALQDLEESDAVRWVDIYGGELSDAEVLALLGPICRGQLKDKMVRDLITPKRFAAASAGRYGDSQVVISSAFRIRHLRSGTNGSVAARADEVTSVFEPVQLLAGRDWLLSCWLPPRAFRGLADPADAIDDSSSGVYLAVAQRWPTSNAASAQDLASLVRRHLSAAAGCRTPIN